MPWTKDRPRAPGELEFHLTGLREQRGEHVREEHDDAWRKARYERLMRRHEGA